MIREQRAQLDLSLAALVISAAIVGCGGGDGKSPVKSTDAPSTRDEKSATVDSVKQPKPDEPVMKPPAKKSAGPTVVGKTNSGITVASKNSPKPKKPKPQTVYRPSDNRPRHDDTKLAQLGIRRYASKRLILYTDIDPKIAARLPAYVDNAYKAWVDYFGALPPTRERAEFQVTGYIMADASLFKQAGLVPVNLPRFLVGRHRDYEFWMNDQKWDYFRRHTMLHEATHCFMYANRDRGFPVWYMEGMADFFGTHHTDGRGVTHFGVMPRDKRDFEGFARIDYIQKYVAADKTRSIASVRRLTPDDAGVQEPYAYAWSWSLCKFLDGHPRYRKRFRELGRTLTSLRFEYEMGQFIKTESPHIGIEWGLFIRGLDYGYNPERAAIDVVNGQPLTPTAPGKSIDLATNRGWQSSGVRVEKGKSYRVTATGKYIIAEKPKPWVCEPQGVSILYAGGKPLGMVVAMIWPESAAARPADGRAPSVIPIGRGRQFVALKTGTLYFRVNDLWSGLEDNTGVLKLRVEAAQ